MGKQFLKSSHREGSIPPLWDHFDNFLFFSEIFGPVAEPPTGPVFGFAKFIAHITNNTGITQICIILILLLQNRY